MIIQQGGGFYGMGKESWFQCQFCGCLHKEKIRFNIEDLYTKIKCPRCRGETSHIYCGNTEDDIYVMYNLNVDPRYY